jgi:hypothetical protein
MAIPVGPTVIDQQGLARYLFGNPWSSKSHLARIFRVSDKHIQRLVNDSDHFYAKTTSFAHNERGFQNLYYLTRRGERDLIGRYRHPLITTRARVSQYEHLAGTRHFLEMLAQAGVFEWGITPHVLGPSGRGFDALFRARVEGQPDLSILAALMTSSIAMPSGWYVRTINRWKKWAQRTPEFPIALIFLAHHLYEQALIYINSRTSLPDNGLVVLAHPTNHPDKFLWEYLDQNNPPMRSFYAPWQRGVGFMKDSMLDHRFILGQRKYYSGIVESQDLDFIRRTEPEMVDLLEIFEACTAKQLEILRSISRFPLIGLKGLKLRHTGSSGAIYKALLALEERALIERRPYDVQRSIITSLGERLLALLNNRTEKQIHRYLGYINRERTLTAESEHTITVLEFFERFVVGEDVVHWNMMGARSGFYKIQAPGHSEVKGLAIHPDSAFAVRRSRTTVQPYWLEVDRGNRRGRRFEDQLRKYFLALYAASADQPVPTIIYLVDTNGRDESRMRYVCRKLDLVSREFRYARIPFILLTGDLMRAQAGGRPLSARPIWRCFYGGLFYSQLMPFSQANQVKNWNKNQLLPAAYPV